MTISPILLFLTIALLAAPEARAHSVGWPVHKVWCAATGRLCDKPPPNPGPNLECGPDQVGLIIKVYDIRLGAFVEWECRYRDDGSYGWFRLRIVPDSWQPFWVEQPRGDVYDWHRRCRAIVCLKRKKWHNYPLLYAEGGR